MSQIEKTKTLITRQLNKIELFFKKYDINIEKEGKRAILKIDGNLVINSISLIEQDSPVISIFSKKNNVIIDIIRDRKNVVLRVGNDGIKIRKVSMFVEFEYNSKNEITQVNIIFQF